MINNLAIGEQINLAEEFNTKLEAPVLQTEMGLDSAASATGQAVRYDEFSLKHNNNGSFKTTAFIYYKATNSANPSATANTYGTPVTTSPSTNYFALYPLGIDLVYTGTFGSETVTTTVMVTFGDSTTANITKTATATGTISLSNSDLMSLSKNNTYISNIQVYSKSTIASSAVTVVMNHYGFSV